MDSQPLLFSIAAAAGDEGVFVISLLLCPLLTAVNRCY